MRILLGTAGVGTRILERDFRAVAERAVELGITVFDTAPVYSEGHAEAAVGRVCRALPPGIQIMTKAGFADSGEPGVGGRLRESALRSADLLGPVAVLQVHEWHPRWAVDDVADALAGIVREGAASALGFSRFSAAQIAAMAEALRVRGLAPPVGLQLPMNALHPGDVDAAEEAARRDIPVWAVSVLGGGVLAAPGVAVRESPRYRRLYGGRRARAAVQDFHALAAEAGMAPAQLAVAWARHAGAAAAIVGADDERQLALLHSAAGTHLSAEVRTRVDALALDVED